MNPKPAIKIVLKQGTLKGSASPNGLQRVATVYVNGQEYRVSAPPAAKGDVLEWMPHLFVRQAVDVNAEIEIHDGQVRALVLSTLKQELENKKSDTSTRLQLPSELPSHDHGMSVPLDILKQSIKLVPANKYAFGVLGVVAAALVSIKLTGGNWLAALVGGVVMVAGMVILRVFATSGVRSSKQAHPPAQTAQVLTWVCIVAFAVVLSMLIGKLYIYLFPGSGANQALTGISKNVPTSGGGSNTLSSADGGERKFTNRTPRELLGFYEGRTALQADKLVEPYKGLWIEAGGQIGLVLTDGDVAVTFREKTDNIECRFDKYKWSRDLSRYNPGDTIKVRGKVSSMQNGQQLYLSECELVGNP